MNASTGSKKRTAVLNVLEARGIIRRGGHFEYRSTEHFVDVVDTDAIYRDIRLLSFLARKLARHYRAMGIEAVVGLNSDAYRSVFLALFVAHELSPAAWVSARKNNRYEMCTIALEDRKRVGGKRVLLIEDVVGSGETVESFARALLRYDITLVGIGVVCDRGPLRFLSEPAFQDCTYRSLVSLSEKRWTRLRCKNEGPCKHHVPVINIKELSNCPIGK